MKSYLENKTFLVVGVNDGNLGGEIAKELHRRGANLYVASRRITNASPDIPGKRIPTDATNARSVAQLFRQIDKDGTTLYGVINTVGRGLVKPLEETTPAEIEDVIDKTLTSTLYITREALRRMLPQRKGIIVNVGSTTGLTDDRTYEPVYTAAQGGKRILNNNLQRRYSALGIAVVKAYPGGMDTEFWKYADPTRDTKGFMQPKEVAVQMVDCIDRPLGELLKDDKELVIRRR